MPQIDFYHLTQSEVDAALVMLVQKCLLAGKKVLVQCPRPAAEAIDDTLWCAEPESWIPHGLDDAPGSEDAPVWITSDPATRQIEAEFLFLLHGAEREDMASFERVFNLFDGRSEAQVGQARARWAALREQADTQMRYFAQDDAGKWEQRA
jgi:DNA polymerase-3 subunit chi